MLVRLSGWLSASDPAALCTVALVRLSCMVLVGVGARLVMAVGENTGFLHLLVQCILWALLVQGTSPIFTFTFSLNHKLFRKLRTIILRLVAQLPRTKLSSLICSYGESSYSSSKHGITFTFLTIFTLFLSQTNEFFTWLLFLFTTAAFWVPLKQKYLLRNYE